MQLHEHWTGEGSPLAAPGLHLLAGKVPVAGLSTDPSTFDSSDSRKQRVLVVDDEQLIAQSLRDILSRAGFEAVFALSGTEAIELAEQICPDIVISDVIMPDVDGVQTAIGIQRACPNTRILLFSGQAATSDILERARAEGHNFELLPKPIHPARLLAAINKLT